MWQLMLVCIGRTDSPLEVPLGLFSRICLSNEDDSGLLVASGIAGRQNDHALDVCRLALDILSKCATFEVKHRPSLRYS